MAIEIEGDLFTIALKQKLKFQRAEITWTSVVIENIVNPDGTNGEQKVTLQFSIVDGPASREWSLMLPSNYQEYITKHPLECTFQSSHMFFRVVEINLESFKAPLVKFVCIKH